MVAEEVLLRKKEAEGFNAETLKYEDLVESGVIDPAKVVRTAIENSSSIASLILTTDALVADIPEKEKTPMMPPGGGYPPGGGMY